MSTVIKFAAFVTIFLVAGVHVADASDVACPSLIPLPRKVEWRSGYVPADMKVIKKTDSSIPAEGYRLEVSKDGVLIVSSDAAGAFYAERTLRQLGGKNIRCCLIVDAPENRWRGFMVDEGRHFFGKGEIKRLIDVMADYKYNVFHWHLTEDQGWRLALDKWPRLTEVGAVRSGSPPPGEETGHDGERYGPFFYTKEDVREVLAYARERYVQVVPEIDFPGHTQSVLAAYPELSCKGVGIETWTRWGISEEVLCVGNPKTLEFLKKVMDEVCELFPSKVVHIGGDECPRTRWKECVKCQALMNSAGLKREGDLQTWLTREMSAHLAAKGRRVCVWNSEVDGEKPPKDVMIQCWNHSAAGYATNGWEVVASPSMETYYTLPIGLGELDPFPYRQWTRTAKPLDLETCYRYSPYKDVPKGMRKFVLGGEVCAWTESTHNRAELEWKMFPRALAHAEVLWSDPQPRDFRDFVQRAAEHRLRLLARGINCSPLGGDVKGE